MSEYLIGKQIKLHAHFTDAETGDDTDPTTVTLMLQKPPSATETAHIFGTDPDVTKDAVGHYTYLVTPTTSQIGRWVQRWKGTGALVTAGEEEFTIVDSLFANP